MSKILQSIRGMHDILPAESPRWQALEATVHRIMQQYGYSEIRMPLVESSELFCRSIGEVTDIVEKEMYTFDDRNGDKLSLRPEGTASCVRAGIQHGLLHNQIQRLWYSGSMFRHERPQKGRYRQFHQLGVEVFGIGSPDIDAELILISARLWKQLGLDDVHLELNSLGSVESRTRYRQILIDYLKSHQSGLDADSLRRLETNPLRILDSKNPELKIILDNAPQLLDYLDEESSEQFNKLKQYLDMAGITYTINPRLVRGLDYYCKTVFEWVTDKLGAQGTVCAGGRYDALVQQLGGKPTPAIGFAMGIERVLALLEQSAADDLYRTTDLYIIVQGVHSEKQGLMLAESLREQILPLKVTMHCGGGSIKSQMKKADKSGALLALILGENEIAHQTVTVKFLRESKEQINMKQSEIINYINETIAHEASASIKPATRLKQD